LLPITTPVELTAEPRQEEEEKERKRLLEEFPDELARLEAEWAQRQEDMDRELEEWENEQARRREQESEVRSTGLRV